MRVWTTRTAASTPDDENGVNALEQGTDRGRRRPRRRYPTEALIFDTESETGPSQRLRFLVWRVYRDRAGAPPGHLCVEEGVAYADDLPDRDPEGFRLLREHVSEREADIAPGLSRPAAGRRVVFEPVSWWMQQRLFLYGYKHRDRCSVVGFNLPFDLGRLAGYWTAARGYYRGGWSLGLWGSFDAEGRWRDLRYHPRLLMKSIDPRRTLFSWGNVKRGDEDARGKPASFIDLRTLAFALTDTPYSLGGACKAFGDEFEKANVSYESISRELIDYAFEDVAHTAILYRNTLAELARHEGIDLRPHRLYSPATVGARYLEAMGVRRPLEKFTSLTDEQLGWEGRPERPDQDEPRANGVSEELLGYAMGAFFGGRAEARVVRTHVPIVHVDFTSMYPAINALLGTWPILRAANVTTNDVTNEVRELLADSKLLERCLAPQLWRQVGVTLVEVEPDGDVLPVRGRLDPGTEDYGIGVNPLSYDGTLWYALPDIIAAALLAPDGEHAPTVRRAIRLMPHGIQDGLRPISLRGASELDPSAADSDPFVVMIEERARVRADPNLSAAERERLQLFLKITANATAYGSLARFDRRDLAVAAPVTIHGPDAPREHATPNPEDPGPYCFPPVAASITAGARMMLALLERIVRDHGGTYAFCDTDSMAIIASRDGGQIDCPTSAGTHQLPVLSWETVREILDRFEQLNPYDPTTSLEPWKVEHDSFTEQLWCYAISAKRYSLYHRNSDGTPNLITVRSGDEEESDEPGAANGLTDWSEHGLGLYFDPLADEHGDSPRDNEGRRLWIREAWEWILQTSDDDGSIEQPAWADAYALTRFTLSSPALGGWFAGFNEHRPREDWIRPGSFGLIAHPDSASATGNGSNFAPAGALPAAPYQSDPARWPHLDWYDRRNGQPIHVTTAQARRNPDAYTYALQRGDTVISTLGQVLGRYTRRPEHKSLAPDGGPAGPATTGLLARRPIRSTPATTELTGKEGNKLSERLTGQTTDPADYRNSYGNRTDPWYELYLPILKELGAHTIIEQTRFSSSAVYQVLNGTEPRPESRACYEKVALTHARDRLTAWGIAIADAPTSTAALYLKERHRRALDQRRCKWCGEPLAPRARADARYDSQTCRKAAERARRLGMRPECGG